MADAPLKWAQAGLEKPQVVFLDFTIKLIITKINNSLDLQLKKILTDDNEFNLH